nr:MAG TPA: hypothetical protein [Caudoviricetes sp.]
MKRPKTIRATIKSNKGFYIGDICYVLNDDIYDGIWGKIGQYQDGEYATDGGNKFVVASTAYGDGCYGDDYGNVYGVDAGVLGLVPLELVAKRNGVQWGAVFEGEGEATMVARDGEFEFTLPNGRKIKIDTK